MMHFRLKNIRGIYIYIYIYISKGYEYDVSWFDWWIIGSLHQWCGD
jgi:hypothetical protein